LVKSQKDFGINLLGPTRTDYKWQAKAQQGFAAEYFQVDWQKQQVICPEGKISTSWSAYTHPNGKEMVKIKFAGEGLYCLQELVQMHHCCPADRYATQRRTSLGATGCSGQRKLRTIQE
jgi:hypothetical protein